MLRTQLLRSGTIGLILSLALAILLALLFAGWSWVENPGGVFRDSGGTRWRFVLDTAASWFLPTLGYSFPAFSFVHFLGSRLISAKKNNKLNENKKPNGA